MFTANMVYQVIFWVLGWEKGLDMLLHHVGFLITGCMVLVFAVYGKLITSAMAMEMSSPFLSLHMLARMLDGKWWALVSNLAMVVFAAVFVVVRLGFYSFAVLEFHYLYWYHHELFPQWTPPAASYGLMFCFTLGWVLQLFWGKLVVSKAVKTCLGFLGLASKKNP